MRARAVPSLFIVIFIVSVTPSIAAENTPQKSTPNKQSSTQQTPTQLQEITITATREAQPRAQETAITDVIGQKEIGETLPVHPSEIMDRIPGVHINVTGGEGHMTAIRQPINTNPVYLYLEDGVPTRSTGFFNHNALYEINLPQAGGIEVSKGPGTALYGSDAIGGIINVQSAAPPLDPTTEITLEGGEYGWARLLASSGATKDSYGWRGDINVTHTDGWRKATDYDRYSTNLRSDYFTVGGTTFKAIFAASKIDQQTAGSSRLLKDDYENNPTANYTPISYRKVDAFRLSSAYENEKSADLLSIIPYVRYDTMELLPNWALSYDPSIYETRNYSIGALAKYRRDFVPINTRLIIGVDVDYSPGDYYEQKINPVKVDRTYIDYTLAETLYDYDVSFKSVSPYVHSEFSPATHLRITTGLRFDYMQYDYKNNLSILTTGSHRRPASATVDYSHVSPKLGAIYEINGDFNGFIAYRHAFRVPSQSQLFRQGRAENTVNLEPVKADNYETGIRGQVLHLLSYEVSFYYMKKRDDILTYQNPDGTREIMNAGQTLHRGVEIGVETPADQLLSLAVSYSYNKHTYEDWKPNSTVDYSGKEMSAAPREIANTRLDYRPGYLNGGRFELEWVHLGSYWMDDANTYKYNGHDLLNLRGTFHISKQFDLFARIINLTDERYATMAAYSPTVFGNPEKFEYAPGMPRTYYAGIRATF